IDAALVKVIRNQQNYYKFPRNYSRIYFEQILLPGVRDSILNFFQEIEKLFQGAAIDVIPEKDYGFNEERQYKQLIPATANQLGKEIRIRGRADLRINPQGTKEHYIFDYKTGGGDRDQLIFYELFYYLIDQPDLADHIFSFFYQVIDQSLVGLKELLRRATKNERIDSFKQELVDVLNHIAQNGFDLPLQKSKLYEMQEIFRSDLFLNMISRRSEDFEQ
ncbi:MAG: PD-(D/E)XK nuclease family protein, partial [bacterium]|nr:PD-(D/E)XK nuclease family protein [bacterium]